ncbi:hypothetical protein JMJ77_0005947, partial [Colletotrichum scovillei]
MKFNPGSFDPFSTFEETILSSARQGRKLFSGFAQRNSKGLRICYRAMPRRLVSTSSELSNPKSSLSTIRLRHQVVSSEEELGAVCPRRRRRRRRQHSGGCLSLYLSFCACQAQPSQRFRSVAFKSHSHVGGERKTGKLAKTEM